MYRNELIIYTGQGTAGMTHETIKDLTSYELAGIAGCELTPGLEGWGTLGCIFLLNVRDDLVERAEWNAREYGTPPTEDDCHEIADSAVPVYTHDLWRTFVDLSAWRQDDEADELTGAETDLDGRAQVALYVIAYRLAIRLAGHYDGTPE